MVDTKGLMQVAIKDLELVNVTSVTKRVILLESVLKVQVMTEEVAVVTNVKMITEVVGEMTTVEAVMKDGRNGTIDVLYVND